MIRSGNQFSGGAALKTSVLRAASFALLFIAFPRESRAAIISFAYDANGNQISQQTATATAPVILGSTPGHVVGSGDIGGFSVTVATPLAVTYQWYFNGAAISGATGDSLLLTTVTSVNDGNYTVKVTNSSGSVTSSIYRLGFDGSGNGLPDSWEQAFFGNLNQTAGGDFDGDSISNLDEYLDGTDPTVREIYYWIAPSGDFNTAANWSRNRVPAVGDTAIINTGTFTLPDNTTITVSQVTVNAPFTAPTDANFTFNVTGNWAFNGPFTLANGRVFAVSGNDGSVSVTGITNLNGASLRVFSGAKLSFAAISTYGLPANYGAYWHAQHSGSELTFPNLATITGGTSVYRYLDLQATEGAKLSLPALTTITKPTDGDGDHNSGVRLLVSGNSSILSAPALSAFNDNDPHPDSSLNASGAGLLSVPLLTAPKGVNIDLNALSHPEQFTSLVGARSLRINAGTVVLSNLTSISELTLIYVYNGAKVSLPNVSTYTLPAGKGVLWHAQHSGSELTFPNLATITGGTSVYRYLDLQATEGAKLSLPALTTITKPTDGDGDHNSGVRLLVSGNNSVLSASALATFYDNDPHPNSSLTANGGGTMILSSLTLSGIRGVTLNGVALPDSVPTSKVINLSTRMRVQTGDNVGIGGFIITGSTPKPVIIRAIGPSLTVFGVPEALVDPMLELHGPSAFATITNDNWRETEPNEIEATGIAPSNDLESAIVATLDPGAYTAIVRGIDNSSGVALVEVYDLNQGVDSRLANLSTRALVSSGDNIVIAGFVLGIGSGNDRIVVRGLGPSLGAFGVPNTLDNPTLELRDTNGALLILNNDWQDNAAQASELIIAGLAPTTQLEAAIAVSLPPGPYTALLSGLNNGAGVGIVEVYDLGGTP